MPTNKKSQGVLNIAKKYGYSNIFATFDTVEEVQQFIESYTGSERTLVITIAGVLQNYYAVQLAKKDLQNGITEDFKELFDAVQEAADRLEDANNLVDDLRSKI